jgi:hypothetical protein
MIKAIFSQRVDIGFLIIILGLLGELRQKLTQSQSVMCTTTATVILPVANGVIPKCLAIHSEM